MEIRSMELGGRTGHEAGRLLLSQMYWEKTGRPMPPVLVQERGKPYFGEGSVHFSITHTKRRVLCVLAEKPVGIDAEEMDRQIDLRLAEKILSPGERRQYEAAPDKRLALLRFWVLKEALAKCSGEGLRGYPRQTELSLDDPRIKILDGCLVAVVREK